MKQTILLLLMITFVSAQCTVTTTSILANSSITIDYDECLNITDINSIIYIENIKMDTVVNMTPYSTFTDTITNTTFICSYDLIGINKSMDYAETYTNNDHQLYLSCPEFPTIDEDINITAGNYKIYLQYNLTINALYKLWDVNSLLQYEDSYINENNNITITAPSYPIKNATIYVDTCDYYKSYSDINLVITSPECENRRYILGRGEEYEVDFFNLVLVDSNPTNENIYLGDGDVYIDDNSNFTAHCNVPLNSYLNFCSNTSAEFFADKWKLINFSNFSCKNYVYTCVDPLSSHCTIQERYNDSLGIIRCVNRLAEEGVAMGEDYKIRYDQCVIERDRLLQGNNQLIKNDEELDSTIIIVAGLIVLTLVILAGVKAWLDRKKEELK